MKDMTYCTWRPGVPLDLAATVGRFSVSRDEPVNQIDGKTFGRVLEAEDGKLHLLCVHSIGSGLRVKISPAISERRIFSGFRKTLFHILGIKDDLAAFGRIAKNDSVLWPLFQRFRGLRISRVPTLFEALITAVTAQQINLSFAGTVRARMVRAYGRSLKVDGVVCYDFPTPRALTRASKSSLRRMQFSDAKVRTIVDLSWAFANGSMHGIETLSTFEAIKRLTEIKGVGSWTAETGLLRGLGRLDAFPADDLAIRKLISEYYEKKQNLTKSSKAQGKATRRIAERWGHYASYAVTYLFHAKRVGLNIPIGSE